MPTSENSSQLAAAFMACHQKKAAFVVLAKTHKKTPLNHSTPNSNAITITPHPSITRLQTLTLSPLRRTRMGNMALENGVKAIVFSAKINYWGTIGISAPDWSMHCQWLLLLCAQQLLNTHHFLFHKSTSWWFGGSKIVIYVFRPTRRLSLIICHQN